MVTYSNTQPFERGGEQADQAPGLTPSEQVRLYASDCRFWGFMGGMAFCLGLAAINYNILGAIALFGLAAWLIYEANKSWNAFVEATWHDAAWLGFYHGRRKALEEFQAGRTEV